MQPIHRSLLAIFAAGIGGLAAALANILSVYMIDKMNERLPSNGKLSIFVWAGYERRRYRQMFPQSRLFRSLYSCVVLSLLFFLAAIWLW